MEAERLKFDIQVPDDLRNIARMYQESGYEMYLVGGAVRDALLGKDPKDFDLATNADPDSGLKILGQDPSIRVDKVGKAFGVLLVHTKGGNEYEIATFREDIGKGRRPDEVRFTTIENDVKRRDLTINALFYDLSTGEIVDYVGGIDDVMNRRVRAVGDPTERFDEDRLRILRAVRFAGRFDSKLDPLTFDAIKSDPDLSGVSKERIRDEFLKGLKSAKTLKNYVNLLRELGLWEQIFPGLRVNTNILGSKDPVVLLALFLRDNDVNRLKSDLKKFKYSLKEIDYISFLISLKGIDQSSAPMLKKEFKRLRIPEDLIIEYYALSKDLSDNKIQGILSYFRQDHNIKPVDLIQRGLQGPEIGREMMRAEQDLFRQLVREIFLGPAKGINYTGIILDEESQRKLDYFVPDNWKKISHHITLIVPEEMKWRLPSRWLNQEISAKMIGIAKDDRVVTGLITFDGEPIPTKLKGLPHVTIAVNPETGGQPVMSNEFNENDFEPLDPIYLYGEIQEVANERKEILLRNLIREVIQTELLNEYVVPMGYGLERWKRHKKKHGITNAEYRRKHPDKKWKVVHGSKKGEIGKPLKGMTNLSYKKANRIHKAVAAGRRK